MFHRRSIALALGLLAGFGLQATPPMHVVNAPSPMQGITRRTKTPRRALARSGAWLPGKKGTPQKRSVKACHHRKRARQRRRAMRMHR